MTKGGSVGALRGGEEDFGGAAFQGGRAAQVADHGEDELFHVAGLDAGLGQELGGAEAELLFFFEGDVASGVDDEREGAEGGLAAQPVDEGKAGAVGQGEVEDEEVGRCDFAGMLGVYQGADVVQADAAGVTGGFKAGHDDGGEVLIVFDEEDASGAAAGMEDAAEFGEEETFVEGLLDPSLGVGDEGRTAGGTGGRGEDAEDDDGDAGGFGVALEPLDGFPAGEAGHVEVEKDGFNGLGFGDVDGVLAAGGFEHGVAVVAEVLGNDLTDAGVVVDDEDGAEGGGG
jgi:hypothetical protein